MKIRKFYESFPFSQSLKIGDYVELIDNDEGRLDGYWRIEGVKQGKFSKSEYVYYLTKGNNILPEREDNLRKVSEEEYMSKKYNI